MNVLVNLNNEVDAFQIKEVHKSRLKEEFPQHQFKFVDTYDEFKSSLAWAESAILWFFPEKLFPHAINLKNIHTPAAGKDWVAIDKTGKVKTHFSSFHGHIIAESFLAMLFYRNNRLDLASKSQSQKKWDRNAFGERSLIRNKKLLIIGFGNIGQICAVQCSSLGLEVAGACRNLKRKTNFSLLPISSIESYIGEFDILLNLLPGNTETEGFISTSMIDSMKDGVEFYNFGRGTTVDQDALIKALKGNKISFAGLDVFAMEPLEEDSELWDLENALITPHSSCCYEDYLHLFIDELKAKL